MTPHLHREFVEGCYRCDLSRDELKRIAAETTECGFCVNGVAEIIALGTSWIDECPYCDGTGYPQEVTR